MPWPLNDQRRISFQKGFVMNYRNAKVLGDGRIDLEFEHPIHGWMPMTVSAQDPHTAELFSDVSKNGDAAPYVPPSASEVSEAKLADLRMKRDAALAASDWTQMPDSPLSDSDKQAWATYRQALRDLPEAGDTWPTEPAR